MTRKSKARYGMNRTYKLNPAVKALRNALFAGMALAAVAPGAQAACTEVGNVFTCTGAFGGTINFGPGDVTIPFDPTTVILDSTVTVNVLGNFGVDAYSYNDLTLVSDGDISVSSIYGGPAIGIQAISNFGDASATNNGTIYADGKYGPAIGMIAVSNYGDSSATNTGDITAIAQSYDAIGMASSSPYGDASASNDGSIYASSNVGAAMGIVAVSPYGDVSVSNGANGDITAYTFGGTATGIIAQSYAGDVTVVNDGSISAESINLYATGINAQSVYGAVSVDNNGTISAYSNGTAVGIIAGSVYDDVSVYNSGDIDAASTNGGAYGIYAASYYGDVSVDNYGGTISASAYGTAIGIDAYSIYGAVSVDNSGDITAYSYAGTANGVNAVSIFDDVNINSSGGVISANSAYGQAVGIVAISIYGDVNIDNSSNITANSPESSAYGMFVRASNGSVTINNDGNLDVDSYYGYATGIYAGSYGDLTITGSGDISAITSGDYYGYYADATGIIARNTSFAGGVTIDVSGDIYAGTTYGNATGIDAYTFVGYVDITSSGDIDVSTLYGNAIGIRTGRYGYTTIDNSGDINAYTYIGSSRGIAAYSFYGIDVTNSGDIDAESAFAGTSRGILAQATYDVSVTNSGNVSATSFQGGSAQAIRATSQYGYASIYNEGDLSATSTFSNSIAIVAVGYDGAYVNNSGNITANNTNANAFGMYVFTENGDALINNYGDITASNYGGGASGIYNISNDNNAIVNNAGDITASTTYGGSYGIYNTALYGASAILNSGDISASSYYDATGLFAKSSYGIAYINSSGDVSVNSSDGIAYGLYASAFQSSAVVLNYGGDIVANSYSDASAIVAVALDDVTIYNGGNLSAYSYNGDAIGIVGATGNGSLAIYNTGNIYAESVNGNAYGIYARNTYGDIQIGTDGDLNVSSYLGEAIGIDALNTYGDIFITNNAEITANGDTASGISANTGTYYSYYYGSYPGNITVSTGSSSDINVTGYNTAYGMNLEADGAVSVSNGGDILATHSYSYGFSVGIRTESGYGTSITNSGTIDAAGDNAWAIVTYADGTTITNTSTGVISGAIWTSANYYTDDSLNNSGKWYVGDINGTNFGDGNDIITNNTSGKIYMDDSYIDMGYGENSFVNNGKLYANGTNNYINMGYSYYGPNVFTNNGSSIHMDDGVVDDSLTIYGNFAGTGHIVVDADGTTMLADRLYIEGDVVTNTANIIDVNMIDTPSLADMMAGDTIDIVHVSGTSTAANFSLGVVTFPTDELYTIQSELIKDINYSGSNDLFSLGFEIAGLGTAGVLASTVSPAVQNMWNQSAGTLFQREGTHREYNQNPDGSGAAAYEASAGIWLRGFGNSGSVSPDASHGNFGPGGSSNFDQNLSGFEIGAGYAFNKQWVAGVFGGTSDSTVKPEDGGRTEINGDTFGAYVTYTPGNGFYADLSYRGMSFDGNSQGAQTPFGFSGDANGFSLELGYGYKTSNGLIIEPQFQYSAVSVDMDTIDYNNSDFHLDDGDSSLLRIGAAVRKSYKTAGGNFWTPYGAISYLDELDGNNSYEIGGLLDGNVDTSGGSALLEAGVSGVISKFGYSLGLNWRDGGAYDSVFGGQVSVRYDW